MCIEYAKAVAREIIGTELNANSLNTYVNFLLKMKMGHDLY